MKSKIYSSRYMKVSSKGMMWIPAFVTIGLLLAVPVAELIMLGNWFGMGYTTREIYALYANLWLDGFMITGLAVAAVAAIAYAVFRHLERDYLDDFDADDFGDNFDDDFIEFSDTTPEAED